MNIHTNDPIIELPFPNSEFLDTAFRVKMTSPIGTVTYLEMVVENTSGDSDDPGMGQISLRPMNQVIEAKTYQTASTTSKENITDLEKMGIDINAQMTSVLDNESYMNMEKQLHNLYRDLGQQSQEKILSKWKKFLRKYFKLEFPIYVEPENLVSKILVLAKMIAIKTRRGPGNFIVTSPMLNSIIFDDARTTASSLKAITRGSSIYRTGEIGNAVKIFVDPHMKFDNMEVVIGRTTEHGNSGVVMGEYSRNLMSIEDVDAMNFKPTVKFELRDRYAISKIGSTPEDSYITVKFKLGKKPLWRKLIGA